MLRKAKVAAVSAAALLLAAVPAFAGNHATVRNNDVSAYANSGENTQRQKASFDGYKVKQTQWMSTGDAVAEASQVIVANSNACGCDGENGDGNHNHAKVKHNDVSAYANTGGNTQRQKVYGEDYDEGGTRVRQTQGMSTGFAGAAASQWIVVNSVGSL